MNKEFLKKCWKNPRWHSLMVLIIWIVSLTILIGIVTILNQFGSPKEQRREEPIKENKRISYEEMWDTLSRDNHEFVYTISKTEETIKYEGVVKEEITTGYRERKDGIIKYTIEDNIVYEKVVDEKKEIETLYENVDENLLTIDFIYQIVKNTKAEDTDILEENEKITYEYLTKVEEEELKIIVITNETQIQSISIEKENEMYLLDFKFIN